VLFSTPGGLLRTAIRENPAIINVTRKIEGPEVIYPYLKQLPDMIDRGYAPYLIDCLNCEKGCNGGPGTINRQESPDLIEHYVEKRNQAVQSGYGSESGFKRWRGRRKLHRYLNKHWNAKMYHRQYLDLSLNNTLRYPVESDYERIYFSMNKFSEADHYNCSSCGYGNCEHMAIAIFNGLNKAENCHYFTKSLILNTAEAITIAVNDLAVNATTISNVAMRLYTMSEFLNKEFASLNETIQRNAHMIQDFHVISETLHDISQQTKVLAVNAAIEAAKAGDSGRGFSIIATEVTRLSQDSNKEAQKIKPHMVEMDQLFVNIISKVRHATNEFNKTTEMSKEVSTAIESLSSSFAELNEKSSALMAFR
jgi:hypothetical protein